MAYDLQPGIYSTEYFSGSQVGIYIGDILVDEVTSLSFEVQQSRRPLFGYADQYYRALSKGQVFIQGQFTINFKEAGYLWLVLDTYKKTIDGGSGKLFTPFDSSQTVEQRNIEQIINGETTTAQRNAALKTLAQALAQDPKGASITDDTTLNTLQDITASAASSLGGFSSISRSLGVPGNAESILESFEDAVWQKDQYTLDDMNRRADDPDLNPFDIYIAYGDFAGDNRVNHTIRKLSDVAIVGTSQQIVIDGLPIQETYTFIARNMV